MVRPIALAVVALTTSSTRTVRDVTYQLLGEFGRRCNDSVAGRCWPCSLIQVKFRPCPWRIIFFQYRTAVPPQDAPAGVSKACGPIRPQVHGRLNPCALPRAHRLQLHCADQRYCKRRVEVVTAAGPKSGVSTWPSRSRVKKTSV
jgi:hypothetical protein